MAVLNSDSVKSLEFVSYGRPFVKFEASDASNTREDTQFFDNFGFFVGASGVQAVITTNNVYIKTANGWVNAQQVYVNVNGNWKRVSNDKLFVKNVSGIWRS